MKRVIISILALTLVVIFGCSQDNSVNGPVDQTQRSLIKLPASTGSGLSIEATNSFTFNVNGWEGAYQTLYLNFPGTNAAVSANYTFPKGVFSGQKNITVTFNNDQASAEYGPSPLQFSAPVIANITYTGLNLSSVTASNVSFVYIPTSGSYVPVPCDRIEVNKTAGTIKVVNAKITHFSRYGFLD